MVVVPRIHALLTPVASLGYKYAATRRTVLHHGRSRKLQTHLSTTNTPNTHALARQLSAHPEHPPPLFPPTTARELGFASALRGRSVGRVIRQATSVADNHWPHYTDETQNIRVGGVEGVRTNTQHARTHARLCL